MDYDAKNLQRSSWPSGKYSGAVARGQTQNLRMSPAPTTECPAPDTDVEEEEEVEKMDDEEGEVIFVMMF